jgi:hypothetical protein
LTVAGKRATVDLVSVKTYVLFVTLLGCAKAQNGGGGVDAAGSNGPDARPPDASCGDMCDQDGDGVFDPVDQCPNTAAGAVVNHVGCADSQLTAVLVPFPPFGLTWTPTGDMGRAGGLTWTYVGIQRMDLFHIDWIVCDDPATPCGMSLDGPIDVPAENWTFSVGGSDFANGKLLFTNTTHIPLADTTTPQLSGRLTVTITDAGTAVIPIATVTQLGVPALSGGYGAEIKGTAFTVKVLGEVQDPTSLVWSPYLDYYDAAQTLATAPGATTSFGGSFYAK